MLEVVRARAVRHAALDKNPLKIAPAKALLFTLNLTCANRCVKLGTVECSRVEKIVDCKTNRAF